MVEKIQLSDQITKEWREVHIGGVTIYIASGAVDCTTAIKRDKPNGGSGVFSLLLVGPKHDDVWLEHLLNIPRSIAFGYHKWQGELTDGIYIVDEESCVIASEDTSGSCDMILPIEGNVGLWRVVPLGS